MWHYGIWIYSPLTFVGVVHCTSPSRTMCRMHATTFNKWDKNKQNKHNKNKNKNNNKKNENKKVTLHILTCGAMRGCRLTPLVACINDKIHDIRKRNVTIRSALWTTNILSLGFWDTREWVILWRLILRSLGCIAFYLISKKVGTVYVTWNRLEANRPYKERCLDPRCHVHVPN